ncbi:MAG: DUF4834 domain-containing protein [Bacteroidota bacterium]
MAPRLLRYAVQRTEERFGRQFGGFDSRQETHYEGETTIHTAPKRKSGPSKNVGEYIDFEEIE